MLNFMLCNESGKYFPFVFDISSSFICSSKNLQLKRILQRIMKKKLTNRRCFPNQKWMRHVIIVSIEDIR